MELDEQHGLNKFTSLKALFKSTDPTKHFHGNKVDKFTSTKDQPELSPGELISTSDSKNKPKEPPKSFKEQLLSVYSKNSSVNESRNVTNLDTAKQLQNGLKFGSKIVKPSVESTNKYSNIKTGTLFNHMNQNQLKNKLISNYHQKYNKG